MKPAFAKWFILFPLFLAACPAADVTPVYFASQSPTDGSNPDTTPKPPPTASCKTELTEANLCVAIQGEKITVGGEQDNALCVPVSPIPLQIEGETLRLSGDQFPDIIVEGHGLPVPITINGKGDGDGTSNVGEGTWSPTGDITIENFSFYITALGAVGEIPELTLTTGTTEETPDLGAITGQPADTEGTVRLVGATVLGHLINESVDALLLGASLTVQFDGTLSPTLADCASQGGEKQLTVVKLRTDPAGAITEEPLPGGDRLEVSQGTTIAKGPQDVGPAFEAAVQFKATSNAKESLKIHLSPQLGPFFVEAQGKTEIELPPHGSFVFQIIFRPTGENAQPGTILQPIRLGPDVYQAVGVALEPSGKTSLDILDENGNASLADAEGIHFEETSLPANSVKKYFRCTAVTCESLEGLTQCEPCTQSNTQDCTLHPVDAQDHPLDAVNKACQPLYPSGIPLMTLDLTGTQSAPVKPRKQVVTIRNRGTKPLVIQNISIEEKEGSRSQGEFQLAPDAIFLARSFSEISGEPASLPVTLPPYQPGVEETSLYLVITYAPNDLLGAKGEQASSGNAVWDRATLKIETESGAQTILLSARTALLDIPELKGYFATVTGLKHRANNEEFAFRDITTETTDKAVPFFLKLADNAQNGLRINSITLEGTDAAHFEWLGTREKIAAKRCSIPILDPTNNQMIDEKFDFQPVSLAEGGFDLKPGAFTLESMLEFPFGCVNFHRDLSTALSQRLFSASLVIHALRLDPAGRLQRNPDGTFKETSLRLPLLAAINPLQGQFVLRVTQTIAAFLNPEFPSLTAMAAKKELDTLDPSGALSKMELGSVLLGAVILDPFDVMTVQDEQGQTVSTADDGISLIFRPFDTHPVKTDYAEDFLFDYASLLFDASAPEKNRGNFFDYPNVPEASKIAGWRIFSGAMSYPGPLRQTGNPTNLDRCDVIDPCTEEGWSKFTDAGVAANRNRGACAFFYASAADYRSPSFQQREDLCKAGDRRQQLKYPDNGKFTVDGNLAVENLGLRFWGPTYFNNPMGPLGNKPVLDDVLQITFTTGVLKPKDSDDMVNPLPDSRIQINKLEHKINLTDTNPDLSQKPICETNTKNRTIGGKRYSSWRYFEPLWSKDEEGKIPTGCPEPGLNDYEGGTAFMHGRPLDPDTHTLTLVSVAKFDDREDLTLALKNVLVFISMNGWLCDPNGSPDDFEGAVCFDQHFNDRDASTQISIMDEKR